MKTRFVRAMSRADLPRVGDLVDMNAMFPSEMLPDMTAPFFGGETDTHTWIVFDKEGVDGVANFVPEPMTDGTWNVLLIAVDKRCHGKGIGTTLMRHIESVLAAASARTLLVETSGLPEFKRTRGFYDMLGYHREARIREYYSAGDDKIIFRKSLA